MDFYHGAYADDHATWPNRALHLFGTFSGLALIIASITVIPVYCVLAFPIVHAVPGLIGHRLFERNAALGDVRVFSGTHPSAMAMSARPVPPNAISGHQRVSGPPKRGPESNLAGAGNPSQAS